MIIFSAIALVAGIILWVVAVAWNIVPPGASTINFALLSEGENFVIAGGFMITAGSSWGRPTCWIRLKEITRLLRGGSPSEEQSALGRLIGGSHNAPAPPTDEERRLRQLDRDGYR
jgi:hypothetical protein